VSTTAPARVASVVFGLLVLSTIGAFFVTQRLKRTPPPVKRIILPHYVAPKTAGPTRVAAISFTLPKADNVTVAVVNPNDDEVRRLLDDRHLDRGVHDFVWNGRDASGAVPPDGAYFVRVVLHGQGRAVTSPKPMELVTKPPSARVVSVTPARVGSATAVTVRFGGPAASPAHFTVYRTDPGPARAVAAFDASAGAHEGIGDGRVGRRPAPAGIYTFAVTVVSRAGIAGTWPRRLPPAPGSTLAGTGLTISGPVAAGPLEPVAAGSTATIDLTGARGRVRWTLRRVGAAHATSRGTGHARYVRVAIPASAKPGVYEASVAGATYPLAVRARGGARVLVVLPALTWQALNPIDGDGDGFADTLRNSPSVQLDRPFAYGREPAEFASEIAPLASFLDSQRLPYDVTTDIALTRGVGPLPAGHRAVVLAGSEPWTTPALESELRGYVASGGRLALFGAGDFRRHVALTGDGVALSGAAARVSPLGDETSPSSSEAAPLVVASDDAGLFAQTSGYVGLFTDFEQTDQLPAGARVVAAAGRVPDHPAFVVYSLGQGLVARVGTAQWSGALASDAQVADVTARLWSMLSR
jgi:hypothetical protein